MTDNDKMREVWDAHDKARNKAWREEPGTFDTLDAFKAGAAWQAAQAEQSSELEQLRKDAERWRAALVISQAALCRPDTREPRVNSMLNAYMRAVNTGVGMTKAVDAAIAAEEKER